MVRAETANADLRDEVASLRAKLALAARDRQQAALAGRLDALRSAAEVKPIAELGERQSKRNYETNTASPTRPIVLATTRLIT